MNVSANNPLRLPSAARAMLVDRIIDWSRYLDSRQETLFLAVYILDRFLSVNKDKRLDMNLLCCTCFFIAMKFEEIKITRISDIVRFTEHHISKESVFDLENIILKAIDFQLTFISPYDFLKRLFHIHTADLSSCSLIRHHRLLPARSLPLLPAMLVVHGLRKSLRGLHASRKAAQA